MSSKLPITPLDFKTCINPIDKKSNIKEDNKLYQISSNLGFHAAKGVRDYMEDTYQVVHFTINNKKGVFYGVFDGHGGNDVSFHLIHKKNGLFPYLIETLKKHSTSSTSSTSSASSIIQTSINIEKIIKNAYLEYDKILHSKKLKAGSTACVVLIFNDKLYLINLGDSKALVFTDDFKLTTITSDHKPNKPIERNRIYKAGYYVNPFKIYYNTTKVKPENGDVSVEQTLPTNSTIKNPKIYLNNQWFSITQTHFNQILLLNTDIDTPRVCNSLALSRAFGDFYLKLDKSKQYMGFSSAVSPEPDITTIDLKPYKNKILYILIATDGFWDVNHVTQNFKQTLKNSTHLHNLCETLVKDSLTKGSTDNISIICDKIAL